MYTRLATLFGNSEEFFIARDFNDDKLSQNIAAYRDKPPKSFQECLVWDPVAAGEAIDTDLMELELVTEENIESITTLASDQRKILRARAKRLKSPKEDIKRS